MKEEIHKLKKNVEDINADMVPIRRERGMNRTTSIPALRNVSVANRARSKLLFGG